MADKKRVLIVGLDSNAMTLARDLLEIHNFVVTYVEDGVEAMSLLEKEKFDIIVADQQVGLQYDWGGPELLSASKCIYPLAIKVLVADKEIKEHNADQVVIKPVGILTQLENAFGLYQLEPEWLGLDKSPGPFFNLFQAPLL